MNKAYQGILLCSFSGNLREDVYHFLKKNDCEATAAHCIRVGEEAEKVAILTGADPTKAQYAGYLHDISAVFPNQVRISIARQLGIEILPEEEEFPMIIHQKLSKEMARDLFNIEDEEILNAVGCHTTLRANSTLLDKVLFVADKIEWDQPGRPPYLLELKEQLYISIDHAAFAYINFLWQRREKLKVIHPWLRDAYYELKG